jgi:hypothetical protein
MPRMSQLEWWLEKEPDSEKATKLWKEHQKSIADKRAKQIKEKFEHTPKWGKWEVLHPIEYEERKRPSGTNALYVKVRCECGTEASILRQTLMSGYSKACRGCYHRGNLNNRWSGYEDMPGNVYHKIRSSAKNRNIPFNITKKQIRDLLHSQNFKCALSGQSLTWETASLDRINSDIPYEIDNLQWVLSEVNYMKRILTQERFVELCKLITENNS